MSIRFTFTEGKTNCSIPSVEEFTNTVLTCHFPEDLGVTKKDFTIYHYVPNGTAGGRLYFICSTQY